MLRNYLKTAVRGMRRQPGYSLINVLGLAAGLTVAFFILLWIRDEITIDTWYEDVEDVYRVMRTSRYGDGQVFTWPAVTYMLRDVLDEDYAEIEFSSMVSWEQSMSLRREDVTFREQGRHAGPDFFRILKHDFIAGTPGTALREPNSLVLTLALARKYFPESFPATLSGTGLRQAAMHVVGERILLNNEVDLTVTGVVADVPDQASYGFDYVVSIDEFVARNDWVEHWGNNGLRMLVRLAPGADHEELGSRIASLVVDNGGGEGNTLFLQPYTDVYLRDDYENGQLTGGRIEYVRIFALVALFVLGIAAINFMNLATARSAQRAMEVGIRKTFGSSRWNLAGQFLGESVITAGAALLLSAATVFLLLPQFNVLTGKSIEVGLADPAWLVFLAMTVSTGILAGIYPAVYLSAFSIIGVLRRGRLTTSRGAGLRRGLVILQFALSVILIVGSVTVYSQITYIRGKNLGMDRKDVFTSRLEGPMEEQYDSFRDRLLADPSIVSVSSASSSPLQIGSSTGGVLWDGKDPDDRTLFYRIAVGYDFLETMKIELSQGRDFSRDFGADSSNFVVNETAARIFGYDDPIGRPLEMWGNDGVIVGVVKDFHMTSLYEPIEPTVIHLDPEWTGTLFVRPAEGRTEQALRSFEAAFREFNPTYPYEYRFVDEEFEQMYKSEIVVGKLARIFTGFAIFIACLGLFGLASFTAERRTKEIGIRKVLGATVPSVVGLLSREYVLLSGLAFAIGAPVAWVAMNRWLDGFEYHTELGWGIFAVTALAVIAITYATVGYQSIRAAITNPADSLRSE
ncbi:MAG: FtsX-like permease family protein [Rhodothermales bacterium]|nr:FtsX-like permease family protein [Rhodothermales bacterium]